MRRGRNEKKKKQARPGVQKRRHIARCLPLAWDAEALDEVKGTRDSGDGGCGADDDTEAV
jgi:hypothetical protein